MEQTMVLYPWFRPWFYTHGPDRPWFYSPMAHTHGSIPMVHTRFHIMVPYPWSIPVSISWFHTHGLYSKFHNYGPYPWSRPCMVPYPWPILMVPYPWSVTMIDSHSLDLMLTLIQPHGPYPMTKPNHGHKPMAHTHGLDPWFKPLVQPMVRPLVHAHGIDLWFRLMVHTHGLDLACERRALVSTLCDVPTGRGFPPPLRTCSEDR
jgi:hypothetical protein